MQELIQGLQREGEQGEDREHKVWRVRVEKTYAADSNGQQGTETKVMP